MFTLNNQMIFFAGREPKIYPFITARLKAFQRYSKLHLQKISNQNFKVYWRKCFKIIIRHIILFNPLANIIYILLIFNFLFQIVYDFQSHLPILLPFILLVISIASPPCFAFIFMMPSILSPF